MNYIGKKIGGLGRYSGRIRIGTDRAYSEQLD